MSELFVERTIWINAPIERAWRAVTEAAQLGKWYAPSLTWEIPSLELGATVKFYNAADDIQHAIIDALEPPHRFSLRWQLEDYPSTLITTFILAEENNGTNVTIREAGYVEQAEADQMYEGYRMSLENLKAHLEGTPILHT